MKRIFALSTGIAALLFLGNCVEGPVTVDDTGHHGPDSATVVTLSNADSLLAANQFGIIEFYSAQCPRLRGSGLGN